MMHQVKITSVFIIFSAIWKFTVQQLPEGCERINEKSRGVHFKGVKCGDGLDEIPSNLMGDINYLEINNGLLENLTISSFSNYPQLQYLLLKHSRISHIEESTFLSLTKLVHLDLSGNNIEELPPLPSSLETLYLNSMTKKFFNSRQTNDSLIQSESSIKRLWLRKNRLKSFPPFVKKMSNLNEIDVAHNGMDEVTVDDLAPLCNLKLLNFTGNKIASVKRNICNCRFVLKWASKYDVKIHSLACPRMPALGDEECETKFPQDDASQDHAHSQCRYTTWLRNYSLLFFILGLIVFIAAMGYCCFRWTRKSAREHETPPHNEENIHLKEFVHELRE